MPILNESGCSSMGGTGCFMKEKNMKLCTTTIVTGLDNKEHFAVVAVGQPSWPIALFGLTNGAKAKKSEAEAKFFADAPVMMDILEVLVHEFGNINPNFPLSAGKVAEMQRLVERASTLVTKHANV
jgi:hypothetical protein